MIPEPERDLFGHVIVGRAPVVAIPGRRKRTSPKGYAAPPGTGPAGETCRTCAHYSGRRMSKIYRKCALMRDRWTGGPGTDILARSPACLHWKAKP